MTLNKYEVSKVPHHQVGALNKGCVLSSGSHTSNNEYDDVCKRRFRKKKNSPYLYGDRIQLLSRITEKRFIQKKNEYFSSFPLANNVYKANSDEFKLMKKNSRQKPKKSVLTLPNVPAPMPQSCTVSDMNDSEYIRKNKKASHPYGKVSLRSKGFEVYDRDAQHIHLDSSSTDFLPKRYNGDGKYNKDAGRSDKDLSAQDVWAVLRNINKFQFRPTPRISEDVGSGKSLKVYKNRRANIHNAKRLIETCRTEEIAYVANFEIQSDSISPASSFDRVTVIHNHNSPENVVGKGIYKHQMPLLRLKYDPRRDERRQIKAPIQKMSVMRNSGKPVMRNNRLMPAIKSEPEDSRSPPEIDRRSPRAKVDSLCTCRDSIDSSNYYRTSESEHSSVSGSEPVKKQVPHPNQIEQIIKNITYGFRNSANKIKCIEDVPSGEKVSKGITQMVFDRPTTKKMSGVSVIEKRKPRLVTTMPSAATLPKLTVNDIKKRLANIKFPLVILGKDQVSSAVEVIDYDPPQFRGLNKHVWPFMLEWTRKNNHKENRPMMPPKPTLPIANNKMKRIAFNNDINVMKAPNLLQRKLPIAETTLRKKTENMRWPPKIVGNSIRSVPATRTKPMSQFKDKMLKLLYKKQSSHDTDESEQPKTKLSENTKVDVATDTGDYLPKLRKLENAKNSMYCLSKSPVPPLSTSIKHPWAKAKWASDFIDNVMRKIKSGVYYSHLCEGYVSSAGSKTVIHHAVRKANAATYTDKDVSVQTNITSPYLKGVRSEKGIRPKLTLSRLNSMTVIPGFDEAPLEFEIKTLNFNQIAVKHRLTNVMVQFDVTVPNTTNSNTNTLCNDLACSSFIPVTVTDSNTRVFKCSTTILNTVLPAELCSIIPKVMHNIFDTTNTIATSTDSFVTVSEVSEYDLSVPPTVPQNAVTMPNEFYDSMNKQLIHAYNKHVLSSNYADPCITNSRHSLSPRNDYLLDTDQRGQNIPWSLRSRLQFNMPRHLHLSKIPRILFKVLRDGKFSPIAMIRSCIRNSPLEKVIQSVKLAWSETVILPRVTVTALICCVADPSRILKESDIVKPAGNFDVVIPNPCPQQMTVCTEVQPYAQRCDVVSGDITGLLQNMWEYCKFNIHFNMPEYINPLYLANNNKSINLKMLFGYTECAEKTVSFTVMGTQLDGFDDEFTKPQSKSICWKKKSPIECQFVNYPKLIRGKPWTRTQSVLRIQDKASKSNLSIGRKTKSISNMDNFCTPLNKISNLDDFYRALGAAKCMASIFEGCGEQKVLSCVGELKNWVKEISPQQAMLVLMLTCKRETQNLVRFRPILLQGIAVNRITGVTELDMEIEVIEKENLKISQCEGISYIPASVNNQDSLLEELYWIAKNTASDYQKPFDETSQKLLKNLLLKRKSLNPSYLRVMARYVGLGLLKTVSKN